MADGIGMVDEMDELRCRSASMTFPMGQGDRNDDDARRVREIKMDFSFTERFAVSG